MDKLTQMHSLGLLTEPQYLEIAAWLNSAATPQQMLAMPQPLWTALRQAAMLMEFDPETIPHLPMQ